MTDENEIIKTRREKLARWRASGGAYPNDFRRDALAQQLHTRCVDMDKSALEAAQYPAAIAGRVMLRRVMGKASFITLQDVSGRIQCYIQRDAVGEAAYDEFKSVWDIGDIVGVQGLMMRTNKGELSVQASQIVLLNKTLRPLPEKYHGLADQEIKYRQRYLDLIMNEESRSTFVVRSQIVSGIRRFFAERDFLEVETPMMHVIPGGATARPFITHHNALDLELYLRVAPELFLKRLTVGGFERVFEINRSFRNEGLSTRHNPEFTMLEFYWAYADFDDLIALTRDLLLQLVGELTGGTEITYQGQAINFAEEPERLSMLDAIVAHTGIAHDELGDRERLAAVLREMNHEVPEDWGLGKLQTELFEARVEDQLLQPTFITHYPAEVSPLSRPNDDDPHVTDRFE
jgi:lysyl-tRNA synthetase class 2